jgi:transposase
MSQSQISRSLNIARSTIQDYLSKCAIASLSYDIIKSLTDEQLEERLFAKPQIIRNKTESQIDFVYIHKELARPGVTLLLLWQEYKKQNPDGLQYSRFCYHYQQWSKCLKVYMRQQHIAGERCFVDYSGKKPSIVNRETGEIKDVDLFVMCWGYSQYIYAEAQPSQKLKHWIGGHVRAFSYFQCAPKYLVPDNYRGAVSKANRYDPDINQSYVDLAQHYNIGVLPARPYHPKDKAKVENSVLIVQRWILARLRNAVFHDINSLNGAIQKLLHELNNKKMQRFDKSRHELFCEIDKPAAQNLPAQPYTLREWFNPKVNLDYHIEINKRYYSVPWTYYGKTVQACLEGSTLSVFYREQRIALHPVQPKEYAFLTVPEHMPQRHRNHYNWTESMLYKKAKDCGTFTEQLIKKIIAQKVHPQQGYRPALGILRLVSTYGMARLEAASKIAIDFQFTRVQQIADILKNGKDLPEEQCSGTVENSNNVRGAAYYGKENVQ